MIKERSDKSKTDYTKKLLKRFKYQELYNNIKENTLPYENKSTDESEESG